jgi:hypothetical protein
LAQLLVLNKAVKAPNLRDSSCFNISKSFPIHPLPNLFLYRKRRSNIFQNFSMKQSTIALDVIEKHQLVEGIFHSTKFVYLFKSIQSDGYAFLINEWRKKPVYQTGITARSSYCTIGLDSFPESIFSNYTQLLHHLYITQR